MTRTSSLYVAVAAGAAIVATVAVAPAVGGDRAQPARQVLTFQEPRPKVAQDDIPPRSASKLSLGDRLAIGGPLQDARHRHLGTFGGSCTVVGAGKSFDTTPLLCQAVYRLAGGQIVAMGTMTLSRTDLVVVGGSADYANVHGAVSPGRVAKGFEDADKLTIER